LLRFELAEVLQTAIARKPLQVAAAWILLVETLGFSAQLIFSMAT